MPITVRTPIRRLTQNEFGDIAYEVMGVVYRLQNDLGRFFVERVYKQALLASLPDVQAEVPIDLVWEASSQSGFSTSWLAVERHSNSSRSKNSRPHIMLNC